MKAETAFSEKLALDNPWRNVYWFSRMLINIDKYGGVGRDSKTLAAVAAQLRIILEMKRVDERTKISLARSLITSLYRKRYERANALRLRVALFCEDLLQKIESVDDIAVFILTIESIMIPINSALAGIPSNDRDFTLATATAYLNELGESGLATVINIWDDIGVEGCLNAERVAVVREFIRLQREITPMPELERSLILTAFVQEFERRLGQKRKGRAGGSLEDVTSFILQFFDINTSSAPDHFQSDLEVDSWVKCKDRWLIGISCKRTLRERWKQLSSADRGILSKFKIKHIWHLITFDEDLSDDKLSLLGNLGHVFYLRDSSRIYKRARLHVGMKSFVRPMSKFVRDLRRVMR